MRRLLPLALLLAAGCLDPGPTATPTSLAPLTALTIVRSGFTNVTLLAAWRQGTHAWVGGQAGVLLGANGGGWHVESTATGETITSIWSADTDDVYAGASNSVILHRNSDGSWSHDSVPVTTSILDVWGLDRDRIWAVGSSPRSSR